jgi:hypothetical protein
MNQKGSHRERIGTGTPKHIDRVPGRTYERFAVNIEARVE